MCHSTVPGVYLCIHVCWVTTYLPSHTRTYVSRSLIALHTSVRWRCCCHCRAESLMLWIGGWPCGSIGNREVCCIPTYLPTYLLECIPIRSDPFHSIAEQSIAVLIPAPVPVVPVRLLSSQPRQPQQPYLVPARAGSVFASLPVPCNRPPAPHSRSPSLSDKHASPPGPRASAPCRPGSHRLDLSGRASNSNPCPWFSVAGWRHEQTSGWAYPVSSRLFSPRRVRHLRIESSNSQFRAVCYVVPLSNCRAVLCCALFTLRALLSLALACRAARPWYNSTLDLTSYRTNTAIPRITSLHSADDPRAHLPGYGVRRTRGACTGAYFENVFQGGGGRGRRDAMAHGATATIHCQDS